MSHNSGVGGAWLLSQTQLFEKLHISKLEDAGGKCDYKPIIEICGEKCYAWSKFKNALIVINTSEVFKSDQSPIDPHDIQEWQLSQRVVFDVTNVVPYSSNPSTSVFGGSGAVNVLLWGKNGLAVVTCQNSGGAVPSERESSGRLRFVKKTILIGEKTYIEHPRLEVIQAKWLPTIFPSHPKIVAVLNSDNYFRFYKVETSKGKEAISCGSVCVEQSSSIAIPFVNRSGRFAADLEDECVADFDIGPCLPKSKYYPLFVLRESGCVSYVLVRFVGQNTTLFSETCGIIPTVGFDSEDRIATSIIVSKQFPTFVAIGFSGGIITHSIILPEFDETINDNGKIDQGQNIEEKLIFSEGLTMVVKEKLELDFLAKSKTFQSEVKLIVDPLHTHRYCCVHDIGVHLVTAHFYPIVVKFFQSNDDEDVPEITSSTHQLLLRWRVGDEVKPARDLMVLGFSNRKPQKLLCVLQDHRGLVFELPDPSSKAPTMAPSAISSTDGSGDAVASTSRGSLRNGLDNTFESGINVEETCKSFLLRSSIEPYLCSKEEIPIRELEEYVMQTIKIKSDRMVGIEDGMQYLMRAVATMQEKLKKMDELVQGLNGVRGSLQSKAESLAETYEECVEQDELHMKKLEAILSKYHHASPVVTDKEKEWTKKLEAIKNDLPDLKSSVDLIKERSQDKDVTDPSKRDNNLTDTQLLQIQKELRSQSESLMSLSYSLKQIKEYMYYPALMSARPNEKD